MANVKRLSTPQRTVDTVRQFVVGREGDPNIDFTYEFIEQLGLDLAKWFSSEESGMKGGDTLTAAKARIKECLLGLTKDGKVWGNAPHDFEKRIKLKCGGYNIEAKRGIPVKKTRRIINPAAKEGAKAITGMTPSYASVNIPEVRAAHVADIITVFPELDNPAHLPNVESLADLYVQRKVISLELELGVKPGVRETLLNSLKTIETMADSMMNKLGIHPNQIKKKVSDDANASVADLVAHISEDEQFKLREKQWSLQLALQLWWMSEHHNYAKDGPNMSDWEIWHLTRSRPIRFRCRCGFESQLVEGFEPHELRDLLLSQGVLVEKPVIPELFTEADLVGLATFQPEVTHAKS